MALVRTLLFQLVFFAGSVVICLSIVLVSPFSKEAIRAGAKLWARWFIGCARILLGIRLAVRGRVPDEAVIAACKHTSIYETILTLYLFHHPAVVMKAELRRIPVWGYIAERHGSIFVERGKAGAALKSMLRQSRARAAEGRPVFIFPEGTRVPFGTAPPLKAGLYGVYSGLKVPIVPISHDAGRVWKRAFVKRPGLVTISFLPDIPAGLPRERMEAFVHAAINQDPVAAEVRA